MSAGNRLVLVPCSSEPPKALTSPIPVTGSLEHAVVTAHPACSRPPGRRPASPRLSRAALNMAPGAPGGNVVRSDARGMPGIVRRGSTGSVARSGEERFDHLRRLDPRQLLIQPLELVREPLVVDPQEVQDRRVEVVD